LHLLNWIICFLFLQMLIRIRPLYILLYDSKINRKD
jgi:hypothetical protein